jgi:hypothetical protein
MVREEATHGPDPDPSTVLTEPHCLPSTLSQVPKPCPYPRHRTASTLGHWHVITPIMVSTGTIFSVNYSALICWMTSENSQHLSGPSLGNEGSDTTIAKNSSRLEGS